MKYSSSDPDLETIVRRIRKGSLNLQPDFQRGEVWSSDRKKKLIDTLLRGWQIPPIHVIEIEGTGNNEVLDGQQRLVAIRDFFNNKLRIDGNIEPYDERIHSFDNMRFDDLPENTKNKLEEMSIRIFTIHEYTPEETAELFYRLNQPVSLTSAEQRNAFYGKARNQVKKIVNIIDKDDDIKRNIGFSNSRMAYDDIIAKFCYCKQNKSLKFKVTSNDVAKIYRSKKGFDSRVVDITEKVVQVFANIVKKADEKLKLNKATVFSWLCFISRYDNEIGINSDTENMLCEFLKTFEEYRRYQKNIDNRGQATFFEMFDSEAEKLVMLFNQKCSMGSTDVSSIIQRDIILWYFYFKINQSYTDTKLYDSIVKLQDLLSTKENIMIAIDEFINSEDWGDI